MIYKHLSIADHAHPIITIVTFSFPKFVSENQLISSIHSLVYLFISMYLLHWIQLECNVFKSKGKKRNAETTC